MSKVYVTADWHLGHRNITKYRPFTSQQEHEATLLANYEKVIRKRDTVLFLGDIVFTPESLELIHGLAGTKVLVLGNHDLEHYKGDHRILFDAFDKVVSTYKRWGVWFTHIPIHESELRGKFNIHGHTHFKHVEDSRYLNVCAEQTEYTPIPVAPLVEELRKVNSDIQDARDAIRHSTNVVDTRTLSREMLSLKLVEGH